MSIRSAHNCMDRKKVQIHETFPRIVLLGEKNNLWKVQLNWWISKFVWSQQSTQQENTLRSEHLLYLNTVEDSKLFIIVDFILSWYSFKALRSNLLTLSINFVTRNLSNRNPAAEQNPQNFSAVNQ